MQCRLKLCRIFQNFDYFRDVGDRPLIAGFVFRSAKTDSCARTRGCHAAGELTSRICSIYSWNLSLLSCRRSMSLANARFLIVDTSSWPAFVTCPRSPACSIVVVLSCWRRSLVARSTPIIACSISELGEPPPPS